MESTRTPDVFKKDEIGIFIGHADDAAAEAKVIYDLEHQFQRELEGFRKINPAIPYSTVRFWEWTEDASCEVGGQACVIDPAINSASIAVFIFKDCIGKVTWDELEKYRRMSKPRRVIAFFPNTPSDLTKLGDSGYMRNWSELLTKKNSLTCDWNTPGSIALRTVEDYGNSDQLKESAIKRIKAAITDLLSREHVEPDSGEEIEISAYLAWINEKCSQMDVRKLAGQPLIVGLPELFIPLYAEDPDNKNSGRVRGKGIGGKGDVTGESVRPPVNIEDLASSQS